MVQKVSNVQHPPPARSLKLKVLVQYLEKPQALQTAAQMKTNGKAGPEEFKL